MKNRTEFNFLRLRSIRSLLGPAFVFLPPFWFFLSPFWFFFLSLFWFFFVSVLVRIYRINLRFVGWSDFLRSFRDKCIKDIGSLDHKWIELDQNGSKRIKIDQNGSKQIKIDQTG